MKKSHLKKCLTLSSLVLAAVMCVSASAPAVSASDLNEFSFTVTGYDTQASSKGVIVYPNETDSPRVISADEYNFRNAHLLIFDNSGRLTEAGGGLLANADGTFGSPQTSVTVPSRGFLVAFGDGAPSNLFKCYNFAFENAMLYNATMTVVRELSGSYDKEKNSLSIVYNPNQTPSEDALKFLFVGNSTTYFNGTPLKFKAMCLAAGIEVAVDYCTFGSAYLSEFADESHVRGQALRKALNGKKYDYVVLQDAGSATYAESKASLDTIVPLVIENGAKPLLYMRYSSSSNLDVRAGDARILYDIYSRLSKDFDAVYAPVVSAFVYSSEDNPDIRLYGDDNSHHSAEGSYLIAATWLYAFLGKSPVGNAFTAYLPEATVSALQNAAVKAVDTDDGSFGKPIKQTFEYDGKKYENIAEGCIYYPTGAPYSGKWTDTDDNSNPLGKLTDGVVAASGESTECGCYKGASTSVTVDLGDSKAIRRIATDLYGNSEWGIPDPSTAELVFSVSSDGKHFEALPSPERTVTGSGWKSGSFSLTLEEEVNARFVKIAYSIAGNFCWTSEILVFGEETIEEPSQEPSSEEISEQSDEPSEIESEVSGEAEPSEAESSEDSSAISAESNESTAEPAKSKSNLLYIIAGAIAVIALAVAGVFIIKRKK